MTEGNPPSSPPCFCTRKCRASVDGGSAAAARTMTWGGGGFKGQREGGRGGGLGARRLCVCVRHSPVSHVVTAGEVEVLQPVEVRRSLGHPAVADSRAVAEGQAGEAAAAPRYRHQAGVADLAQPGQG